MLLGGGLFAHGGRWPGIVTSVCCGFVTCNEVVGNTKTPLRNRDRRKAKSNFIGQIFLFIAFLICSDRFLIGLSRILLSRKATVGSVFESES